MLSEDVMLGAVMFGHEQMQAAIKAINELVAKAGKPAWDWKAPAIEDGARRTPSRRMAEAELGKAYSIIEKQARHTRIGEIKKASSRRSPAGEAPKYDARKVAEEFGQLEYNIVRRRMLDGQAAHRRSRHAHRAPDHASRPACCRARTARRCSRAARRRRSSPRRSAPAATRRSSTRSPASAKSRSCSTTTSRRSRWARRA